MDFIMQLNDAQRMDVQFSEDDSFSLDFGGAVIYNEYGGPYEVTPTNQAQVLYTAQNIVDRDIIINPIPSNYGLVSYDGAIITVS